jgi:hypothetical protein
MNDLAVWIGFWEFKMVDSGGKKIDLPAIGAFCFMLGNGDRGDQHKQVENEPAFLQ